MLRRNIWFGTRRFFSQKWANRITPAEYDARRSKLVTEARKSLKTEDCDVLFLMKGSATSYIAPDVPHAFRQNSNFRYITGIDNVPGCMYLYYSSSSSKSQRILFMDKRSEYEELWEGCLPTTSDLEVTARFDEILPTKEILKVLQKFANSNTVLFVETDQWKSHSAVASFGNFGHMKTLHPHIEKLRVVKSADEILSMEDVCQVGSQMMASLISNARNLDSELTLVGLLEYEARRRGAERLAYPPVVAAGNRANTIHYLDANKIITPGDCLLVDAGCDLNGYVSDITRCFPITGNWTDAQLAVYEALRYVHENLLEYAHNTEKIRLSTIFKRMIELLASTMLEVGVIPQGTDSRKAIELAEELCPHHVGHYLGMDVHDCPSVSRDIELTEGFVFTIEPGVYIPQNSDFPEEFRGIGFRIEDDILKTANGINVLTDSIPRVGSEVEYLMNPQ